nr:hypothetical protein [Tanacetum cinerariifolium]
TIISDSEDSTVKDTTVSSPYEGRLGDVSPGVDGPPVIPEDPYAYVVTAFQALPSPDYVPGTEEPEQAPPSPVYIPYVPEPEYLEYIPPEDEVFSAEEQPLPAAASPTTNSPGYILESDSDEDLEDDDDKDPEEDPVDYPADHDEEEEKDPSGDDADEENEEQDEDDDDMEEEHPASADSIPPPPALDTWIDPRDVTKEEALTTLEGVNTRVTELAAGHLATALGEIQALQTREQTRTGAPEGASSSTYEGNGPKESGPKANYKAMIDQGVNVALAARDANRTGDDSHTSGTGVTMTERVTRECTYQDFMKCQPLYFKGTAGVDKLTQWFERMEMIFRIRNCLAENQVKFATCTLLAGALTWWNSHVRIVGTDADYVMTWIELKKKMADKYCSRNEMKRLRLSYGTWKYKVQPTFPGIGLAECSSVPKIV